MTDEERERRIKRKSISGETLPLSSDEAPIPVILTKKTILKLVAFTVGPLLIGISTVLCFYWQSHWKVESHLDDKTIHLKSGQITELETKKEAVAARRELLGSIKRHQDLLHREQVIQLKESVLDLEKTLEKKQTSMLNELKRTGTAIKKLSDM